jgi:hypothetical protein
MCSGVRSLERPFLVCLVAAASSAPARLALARHPSPIGVLTDVRIFWCELVSVLAMREFSAESLATIPALRVTISDVV